VVGHLCHVPPVVRWTFTTPRCEYHHLTLPHHACQFTHARLHGRLVGWTEGFPALLPLHTAVSTPRCVRLGLPRLFPPLPPHCVSGCYSSTHYPTGRRSNSWLGGPELLPGRVVPPAADAGGHGADGRHCGGHSRTVTCTRWRGQPPPTCRFQEICSFPYRPDSWLWFVERRLHRYLLRSPPHSIHRAPPPPRAHSSFPGDSRTDWFWTFGHFLILPGGDWAWALLRNKGSHTHAPLPGLHGFPLPGLYGHPTAPLGGRIQFPALNRNVPAGEQCRITPATNGLRVTGGDVGVHYTVTFLDSPADGLVYPTTCPHLPVEPPPHRLWTPAGLGLVVAGVASHHGWTCGRGLDVPTTGCRSACTPPPAHQLGEVI